MFHSQCIHSCVLVSPLQYLCLLLCIFLLELIAGVLAFITYQEVKLSSVRLCSYIFDQSLVIYRCYQDNIS